MTIEHFDRIHHPIAFARHYLAGRHLLGHPDEDELIDVAIMAIVDAVLAWNPNGGRSITSWCYLYLERNTNRALARRARQRHELGADRCHSDDLVEWANYQPGTDWYHRIELRIDLQRWADLAALSDHQRFLVQWTAYHRGVYVRDTPLAGEVSPLHRGGGSDRQALKHMRRAAITGQRRDDRWTRARANRARRAAEVT